MAWEKNLINEPHSFQPMQRHHAVFRKHESLEANHGAARASTVGLS